MTSRQTCQALPHESRLPGQVVVGGKKALAERGSCEVRCRNSKRKYHGIQKESERGKKNGILVQLFITAPELALRESADERKMEKVRVLLHWWPENSRNHLSKSVEAGFSCPDE